MRANYFRLITLGRFALESAAGEEESLTRRRRKLALLAVLALATRPYSRDALVDLFWGEEDEERARHSLSDALSHLRRVLGREAITSRRSDIVLSEQAKLAVDAVEFAAACEARDHARAVSLYGGPFLDGVYVERSPRFETWVMRERGRLARLFVQACAAECLTLARARRWDECAGLAGRWLEAAPLSVDAALYLINARKAPGTQAAMLAALDDYRTLASRLEREYDTRPDARVAALADELEARLVASAVAPEPPATAPASPLIAAGGPPSSTAIPAEPAAAPGEGTAQLSGTQAGTAGRQSERRIGRSWRALAAAAAVLLLFGATTYAVAHDRSAAADTGRPIVAIAAIQNLRADTAVAWLEDGIAQMITADLSRSTAVDVVAPSRVREVIAREQRSTSTPLSGEEVLELGKRLGATWVASGGITRGDSLYVLDVTIRGVATGHIVQLFTVTGSDVLAIADEAAARILEAAHARTPGPHLADVETANLDAYQHYIRSVQAGAEGRAADERRELDIAIAEDSGFVSALLARMRVAERESDWDVLQRLGAAFRKAGARVTQWDRMRQAVHAALHNGERARAEELGRALVERYPYDPRAYKVLADLYAHYGQWAAVDSVLVRELSLDSLATMAGTGPCAPCTAFGGLVNVRITTGDLPGAERAARRWVALQPDLPSAWFALGSALALEQRFDAALAATRRAVSVGGDDPSQYAMLMGRILLMARRYDAVDSLIALWRAGAADAYRENAFDLQTMLQRERGELRASNRTITRWVDGHPADRDALLMKGQVLGRLGRVDEAGALFERHVHSRVMPIGPFSPMSPGTGDWARAFCWEHALEADAIAAVADTTVLRVLADSIESVSVRSYYGRDRRLAHHVRGLIAMRGGRYAEAEREFQAARWGVAGWTRTVDELGRVQLALGRPRDAIATLRHGYETLPDAMGRYEPRSELDFLMALAFRRAGMADSSAVYTGYVRRAWRDADPEVKAQLATLEPRGAERTVVAHPGTDSVRIRSRS